MTRAASAWRRYPLIGLTLASGAVGLALVAAGRPVAAQWWVSVYALALAGRRAVSMVASLRRGRHGVDLLAVTAVVAAVAVGEHWAALVVVLMLATGEALDDLATARAGHELSALLERTPRTAHLLATGDGGAFDQAVDVAADTVCPGDAVLVKPGEIVPVDGVLLSSAGAFDESSLTGEPMPVERERGEQVLSGSVNGSRAVHLRATAAAADSQYQQIVGLVASAQASRAPFVRLADRVAVPFTAAALALAGAAWWLSGEAGRFAEVLVVATPCPLLIAAPVAFMAGLSRAARHGVIVKDGGTLERLAKVRTAAFDKTGTLTLGAPELAAIHTSDGVTADDLLALAASVEHYSTHPLATAIVAGARERGLDLPPTTAAAEVAAHGATATVGGREVAVGKAAFVAGRAGGMSTLPLEPGESAVHVAVDGRYAGLLALGDRVRPEARRTVEALRRAGVRHTVMLTGDAEATALHVAEQVGVDEVRAGLLPQDKVDVVAGLADRPVMMVGDGVNDAPVLAAADVGVAMGARGSGAASESADVVVLLDDLSRTVRAVQVGRRTLRVAWQAIGLGLGLSGVLMVAAAAGHVPALWGAWSQEVVDLVCILWALLAGRPGAQERAGHPGTGGAGTGGKGTGTSG
ncbi:MAG TPA: heavy metal translocating P-type ATPase [Pedococcus sp.]